MKRMSVKIVAFALLLLVPVAGGSPQATDATQRVGAHRRFAIARAPYAFVFPRDHGAHPDYQSEWWYYTGHVRTKAGRRFGYELTFFRVGLRPGDPQPGPAQSRWRGHELYPAHFALTDEAGKTFYHVDRFAREALGLGAAATGRLDVRADDWTLRGAPAGAPDLERMAMFASQSTADGTNAIDFVLSPEKRPAIHGHGGVSRKAACRSCASHYYSYTRLHTTGTLTSGGQHFAVDGLSWMDHEYGSDELQRDQAGWDWFALQLDDKRELMLYLLRQKDGSVTPQSSGSLVERDGSVRYLPRSAFAIEHTATWNRRIPAACTRARGTCACRSPASMSRSRRRSPIRNWPARRREFRIGKARLTCAMRRG